ncbi:MAG: hypothetical protein HQ463_06620 [Bacteroidetes bacterium]|nr:hypothetical protein [Bacteroidota bacterium]
MKGLFIFLFLVLNSCNLFATGYLPSVGSEANALGGCSLLGNNAFCAINNPSLICWQKEPILGVVFRNYYGVKDINQLNIAGLIPYKNVGYGFNIFSFGNGIFKQQSIGASASYALNKQLNIGMGADYQSIAVRNYGQNSVLTIHGGISAKINNKLQIAFHVFNPMRAKFSAYKDERIQSAYKFGLSYLVSIPITTYLEVEKNNLYKANLKASLNYQLKNKFNIRCGFSTTQPQFGFGIGYKYHNLNIDAACVIHQFIGVSNNISLQYKFGK